jgi:hypothetical protein
MKAAPITLLLAVVLCTFIACNGSSRKAERARAKALPDTPKKIAAPAPEPEPPKLAEVPPPTILSRQEWNAKPPTSEMKPHELRSITIHHTATKQNPKKSTLEKMRSLQDFSQREGKLSSGKSKPPWPDVPYHFVVMPSGEIAEGRDILFVGDTNTEYDPTGHILVTLDGNFEDEELSEAQWNSTVVLVKWLAFKYKVPADKIGAHKDFAKTACPGKRVYARIHELQEAVQH